MRIADKMQTDQVMTNLQKNRSQMNDLQNQAATQRRINKPSDDPLSSARVLSNRSDLKSNTQFSKSLTYAKSYLEYTDQSLSELGEILTRAKELALGQSTDGGSNEQTRHAVATELEELSHQMVSIGNRKLGDRYIFGGFHTQNAPFDDQGKYGGDGGEMMIHVDKESFVAMNIPGERVFLGVGISPEGVVKSSTPQAKTIDELNQQLHPPENKVDVRGPASEDAAFGPQDVEPPTGINLFHVVKALGISLSANDKTGIQDTLEILDDALNQVINSRAQVGSRAQVLDSFMQTVEKQKVDNKTMISSLEDADIYNTVNDITKNQNTLQATLETSGKLIQPSLLSFLR